MTLTDSTPDGIQNRANNNDFVGILDGVSPNQMGGQNVNFNPTLPTGVSFLEGDLVARDLDTFSNASRDWTFEILLPGDAAPGTGLTDITFRGFAFERTQNNLEAGDQVTWAMYLNNDTIPIASDTPGDGIDFDTHTVSLINAGGAAVTRVRVVVSMNGFNQNGEWVASRGQLSANYQAIPEPASGLVVLSLLCLTSIRRARRCST